MFPGKKHELNIVLLNKYPFLSKLCRTKKAETFSLSQITVKLRFRSVTEISIPWGDITCAQR